jgi:hypothetical protein
MARIAALEQQFLHEPLRRLLGRIALLKGKIGQFVPTGVLRE